MPVLTLPSTPAPSGMGINLLTNKNVLVSALGGDEAGSASARARATP